MNLALRRDYLAYALIALFGIGAGIAIHINASFGYQSAQDRFRAESHAATQAAANQTQMQFDAIFQNIRTISRLPSVKSTDREGTTINQDAVSTIQEIYNNLASDVAVSEVYIVPKDLDSDQIDPVTGQPQKPILSFADLLDTNTNTPGQVTKRFEAEIYEYHLLHRQMLWFEAHYPDISTTTGLNLPMISGAQCVTCDNTVYNLTLDNADRTGMIFSVPFFGPDGKFKGTISAIIRVKAIRGVLPNGEYALVNSLYDALLIAPGAKLDAQAQAAARKNQPDPRLIYSEVVSLNAHDPQSTWTLWAAVPNAAFYARPDVHAVDTFEYGAYFILAVLLLIFSAATWFVTRNAALINRATAALDALAHGDENTLLAGAEKPGAIGGLARAFIKFRDALIEKRRTEEQAAADREAAERDRQRYDEERVQALTNQKQVTNALAKALISFANGDLSHRIEEYFSADFKGLRMDFNQASSKMEATMRKVMESTRTVTAGSHEINGAAADLARRIEQQAAQLEESAATLVQVTGTVGQTSQNAGSAAQLAAAARADATASADVVRDTVNAMQGIEASSKKIANIISVIDEIAFQTNLLALNAGVEAARAGDAGRGFTVVATEVRALAQRSADAAKEIKSLISASGQQVSAGVKLVNETGATLERITGQIKELADLVHDIAGAAQNQATALKQVSAAVNDMDRATQQNAAMIEQTTAASTSLTTEAAALTRLVDEFTMGDAPIDDAGIGKGVYQKPSSAPHRSAAMAETTF
jgi:methyl-accepting chemotaxis protein